MEQSPRSLTWHTAAPSFPLTQPWSSCQAQHLCHLDRYGSRNNLRSAWIWFSARTNGTPVHGPDPGSCWVRVAATHLLEGVGSIWFSFFSLRFWNVSIFPSLSGKTMTCRPVGLPARTEWLRLPITRMVQACSFPGAAVTTCRELGGWKQQKYVLSQVWGLETQSQGVGRVASFWRPGGRSVPRIPSSFRGPPAIPRLVGASL